MTTKLSPKWERRESTTRHKGDTIVEIVMVNGNVVAKGRVAPPGTEVTMSNTNGDFIVRVIAARSFNDCFGACLLAAERIGAVER